MRRRRRPVVDEPGRVQRDHAVVDARLQVWVRGQAVRGDVGGGNAELDETLAFVFALVLLGSVKYGNHQIRQNKGKKKKKITKSTARNDEDIPPYSPFQSP